MNSVPETKEILWRIFAEYWDDGMLVGETDSVFMDARTLGVMKRVFGSTFVTECLDRWEQEGSVKLLGNPDELNADTPCVQIKDYVSNIPRAAE